MDRDSSPFQYGEQLDEKNIRILTLHSVRADGVLDCSLDLYAIDQLPEFHALSYFWGEETRSERVAIGDRYLPLTANAYAAIRRVVQVEKLPMLLWVDGICINQDDAAEKAQQVSMMDVIYCEAESVFAWLGEPEEGFEGMIKELIAFGTAEQLDEADARRWAKIGEHAVTLPWFRRMWVVQEGILARRLRILHGAHCDDWDDLNPAFEMRPKLTLQYPQVAADSNALDDQSHLNAFIMLRKGFAGKGPLIDRLDHLIFLLAGLKCRDDRDHIYALVGIAKRLGLKVPRVDYSASATVATALVDAMMGELSGREDGVDGIVWVKEHAQPGLLDIPTWMPSLERRSAFILTPLAHHLYSAGGPTHLSLDWTLVSADRRLLTLPGFEICSVGEILLSGGGIKDYKHIVLEGAWIGWLRLLKATADKEALKGPGSVADFFKQLARTVVADGFWPESVSGTLNTFDFTGARRCKDEFEAFDSLTMFFDGVKKDEKAMNMYLASMMMCLLNRSLIVTRSRKFALVPGPTRPDDLIVVFPGVRMPVVLRKRNSAPDRYEMIGAAYVDGIMDGEAMKDGHAHVKDFVIE